MMRIPDNYKKGAAHVHVELPLSGAMANVTPHGAKDPELMKSLDNMAMKAKLMLDHKQQAIALEPFTDVHGNVVYPGCRIRIIRHRNTEKLFNQVATVIWNAKQGMFMFTYTEEVNGNKRLVTLDFYGVHEFEIVEQPRKAIH